MTHRDSFLASPCVPSPVSAIRTPKLPLLPLWEFKGGQNIRSYYEIMSHWKGTHPNVMVLVRWSCHSPLMPGDQCIGASVRHSPRTADEWFRQSAVAPPMQTRQRLIVLTLGIVRSGSLALRRIAPAPRRT
jgi:hypothetical protein